MNMNTRNYILCGKKLKTSMTNNGETSSELVNFSIMIRNHDYSNHICRLREMHIPIENLMQLTFESKSHSRHILAALINLRELIY